MIWLWLIHLGLNYSIADEVTTTDTSPSVVENLPTPTSSTPTTVTTQAAKPIEALYWKGRFHIEGFSFKGAVPGELVFGPNNQLEFGLMRPSGLPIMSLTVLEEEMCLLFDLDGVQYRGSHDDFANLTEGAVLADTIHLIFQPNKELKPEGWDWYGTPRVPIRALDVDTQDDDFLNAGYKGWRRKDLNRGPGRIYVHLGPNDWKLRANIMKRTTTVWEASCDVDESIEVKPLKDMLEALPKN